jgi:alpha-N-arabinofuranosidase
MVALLRDMNSSLIRFGGNFTSGYHWRDGVGPREKRPCMINQSWGIPEYNHFGTDEFLALCEKSGSQPMIALNLGSGTPKEAADWVRYVNARWGNRKGGLLWELGNELWGTGWQIGYPTEERLAERTLAFSKAVRKVDPSARLIATGGDPEWAEGWNARLLSLPPGTFNYMATHFVDTPARVVRKDAPKEFVASAAFALPVGLERLLGRMAEQIERTPWKGKAAIAFTEWLFISPPDRAPDYRNMGGAVCVGGMLNMLMRRADICPVSTMTGIGCFHGMMKERSQAYGTPSYWAFRMYTEAKPARLVYADVQGDSYDVRDGNDRIPDIEKVPYLDVSAALGESGDTLTLFCVNRDLERPAAVSLRTGAFAKVASARVLRADSIYDGNSAEAPDAVLPAALPVASDAAGLAATIPPASVVTITLGK